MKDFRDGFKNGSRGYGPAVMWFSAGNIDLREMTRQLEGFKQNGIEDFFIHPVDATQGDYLGEHFFRMIRHAIKEARRLGLNYWIYDEYNWPSGVAGGQVLRDAPWAKMSCVCKYSETAAPGQTIHLTLPDRVGNNTAPLLFAVDGEEVVVKQYGDVVEWTNDSDEEKTLDAFVSKWMRQLHYNTVNSDVIVREEGYLDTLDPEAVNVFIQKVHEVYKANIGEEFGKAVRGVFTDEVPLSYVEKQPEDFVGRLMPWTRRFREKFLARNGYDICPKLPALFAGKDARLLIDYWETITELFLSAYMDITYDWCNKNGLIFTGHLLYEEEINKDVVYSGDPYECYRRFRWPGVDSILSYYRINDYNFNITAKMGSSALRFAGKERLLCESYTLSGWFVRLRDMKRIFNRLMLNGVTFIQYMGARYDFRPAYESTGMSHNWQNPQFRHYDKMAAYISGLQNLVANTTYRARALLYYPLTTARTLVTSRPPFCTATNEIDRTLQGLVNSLLNLNVPFEVGYEQVIDTAEVEDGRIIIAGTEYDVVILPCARYIKARTFEQLRAFARGGGRIIAVNGKPEFIVADELQPADELSGMIAYECRDYDIISDKTRFDTEKVSPMGAFAGALRQALHGLPEYVYSIEPTDGIMSALRQENDAWYVIVINDEKKPLAVRGHIALNLPFHAINADTGEEQPMTVSGGSFEFTIDALNCVVIEIAPDAHEAAAADAARETEDIVLEHTVFAPTGLNIAMPDLYQVRGAASEAIIQAKVRDNPARITRIAETLQPDDMVRCRSLFNKRNPVEGSPDWYGWYPVDGVNAKAGETVVGVYDFEVESLPEVLELIGEPHEDTRWYLNSERLFQTGARREFNYASPVFDLTGVAKPGRNRLVCISTMPDVEMDAPLYPMPFAMLKGDFRIFPDARITTDPGTNELDYWNGQGYYFYTGDGVYSADFTAKAGDSICIEIDTTDIVEVFVNGISAGRRIWDPYKMDLTPFIRDGVNKLEVCVTSTGSNWIHAQTPSGLGGIKLYRQL